MKRQFAVAISLSAIGWLEIGCRSTPEPTEADASSWIAEAEVINPATTPFDGDPGQRAIYLEWFWTGYKYALAGQLYTSLSLDEPLERPQRQGYFDGGAAGSRALSAKYPPAGHTSFKVTGAGELPPTLKLPTTTPYDHDAGRRAIYLEHFSAGWIEVYDVHCYFNGAQPDLGTHPMQEVCKRGYTDGRKAVSQRMNEAWQAGSATTQPMP